MRNAKREREAEIRGILEELEQSGESVQAFAKRRGISAWTIYDWRRRFGGSRRRARRTVTKSTLIPVRVDTGATSAVSFAIELNGVVVRVPAGFDEAELVRLVRALGSAC